ncbi:hypothetical protein NBRC3293_1747 [Gluconobacter oxydans NBRC 3293]|uniref:Uncharacterized protein n=1 Tax=Gluconobacter oxydans NBRC 3293 TaxID=1315969 RepID=A0A829X333_GLUOY|nr:hypothetical protein NBRC3293_1747 [Gluconobacter oxydans NBRC 3293]
MGTTSDVTWKKDGLHHDKGWSALQVCGPLPFLHARCRRVSRGVRGRSGM